MKLGTLNWTERQILTAILWILDPVRVFNTCFLHARHVFGVQMQPFIYNSICVIQISAFTQLQYIDHMLQYHCTLQGAVWGPVINRVGKISMDCWCKRVGVCTHFGHNWMQHLPCYWWPNIPWHKVAERLGERCGSTGHCRLPGLPAERR